MYIVSYHYCRWLDKLGVAAAYGVDLVMRQAFFNGHYGLISGKLNPRPVSYFCIKYSLQIWLLNNLIKKKVITMFYSIPI